MHMWYYEENLEENMVDNIGIRCSNCGKTIGLYVNNKNDKGMVTNFVLNKVVHHVGLSWIIESNQQL